MPNKDKLWGWWVALFSLLTFMSTGYDFVVKVPVIGDLIKFINQEFPLLPTAIGIALVVIAFVLLFKKR